MHHLDPTCETISKGIALQGQTSEALPPDMVLPSSHSCSWQEPSALFMDIRSQYRDSETIKEEKEIQPIGTGPAPSWHREAALQSLD